ncbi:MAG: hypothetical protein JW726_11445 [Anaerolineales bacterium]|nr:hypothetical protein [Anaerolineales bacterium]
MTDRRGRPPREGKTVSVAIHLRLRQGEDDDLITYFASIPQRQRAPALKMALRSGGMSHLAMMASQDDDLDKALDGMLW